VGRDETVAIYEEAIGLYKGDFMPGIKMLYWVTPLAAYYRSLFLASVRELLVIYAEQGEHEKTEIVCADALRNNIVDETIYYYLINSRIKSGKIMLAMKTYETAIDIIGKELGVKKSKLLTKAYEQLMAAQGGTDIAAIDDVANDLAEDKPEGVFLCGYHVFKEIYRLQIRRMLREGDTCQMLLLTLDSNASVSDKINAFRIGHAMERLEKILISSLRMCDIAARYNESQFVVLLPSCESQNCGVVADRIRYKFENDELVHNSIKLTVHSDELTPDGNSKMLEI
jgi:GGDEF domain-containing protein